jgi:hypothetical protein|tara:strand:+ start:175 stop:420 length:246 start_codon:yes stop_codon:yes gene_type:complete
MTSLSTQQINVKKFKYQKLKTQKDVKKLKEQLIDMVSDYIDNLLQDFVVKEKELEKLQKKLENMVFLNKVAKSYNTSKKKN